MGSAVDETKPGAVLIFFAAVWKILWEVWL